MGSTKIIALRFDATEKEEWTVSTSSRKSKTQQQQQGVTSAATATWQSSQRKQSSLHYPSPGVAAPEGWGSIEIPFRISTEQTAERKSVRTRLLLRRCDRLSTQVVVSTYFFSCANVQQGRQLRRKIIAVVAGSRDGRRDGAVSACFSCANDVQQGRQRRKIIAVTAASSSGRRRDGKRFRGLYQELAASS